MIRKFGILFLAIICSAVFVSVNASSTNQKKKDDYRTKEIKYKYEILKSEEKDKLNKKILDMKPSGYMTVEEYEALSEYKNKSTMEIDIPKVATPADFKYVPKPLYKIEKYNNPPGGVELSLGRRLFNKKQINAQGIISPDYSMLIYPAVYYYSDSVSVACDLFIIPLENENDTILNRILKANTAKKIPTPILSTDKAIDNYAAFRTLTPVDFSVDGTKLLVKEKIGSSEDGIWQTLVLVYDFVNKTSYNLSEVRDAIAYFWLEYMELRLDDVRWDIYPIGFDINNPDRILVQGFAYTGEKPVFLGTWSVDWQGNQARIESFDKNEAPLVSVNGYKIVQNGVEDYTNVEREEKIQTASAKVKAKQQKKEEKDTIKEFKQEYKFGLKMLDIDMKEEIRDMKKLTSMSGATENIEMQEAYKQYLIDQINRDIEKDTQRIDKLRSEIERIDGIIEVLYNSIGDTSSSVSQEEESSSDSQNNENQE